MDILECLGLTHMFPAAAKQTKQQGFYTDLMIDMSYVGQIICNAARKQLGEEFDVRSHVGRYGIEFRVIKK